MTPTSVLITGGGGFVGRHLVTELLAQWPGVQVMVWDTKPVVFESPVLSQVVDITDARAVEEALRDIRPDWVVHLAAIASIPLAAKDPALTRRVNVEGTRHVLLALQTLSLPSNVLAISSADIYPASQEPLGELPLAQAVPRNEYAQTKREMEQLIEEEFSERCLRVRPFPHIGPGQGLGFVTSDFASQIAAIEAGEQPPVMKVGNVEAQRDFTDVRDVVRAYRLLMEKGEVGQVYNVASGQGWKIQAVLQRLLDLSSTSISVEPDPARMRKSDNPYIVGNARKLREATGWEPSIPISQSLEDILNYWRSSRTSKT